MTWPQYINSTESVPVHCSVCCQPLSITQPNTHTFPHEQALNLQPSPSNTTSPTMTSRFGHVKMVTPQSRSQMGQVSRSTASTDVYADAEAKKLPFYHGLVTREEAEQSLKKNGDYLLRRTDVKGRGVALVLCNKWANKCQHFLITRTPDAKFHVQPERTFSTVRDMLEWYRKTAHPVNGDGSMLRKAVPRPEWMVNPEDVKVFEQLGSGAFGEVFRGTLQQNNIDSMPCAIKVCKQSGKTQREQFLKEARIMRAYDHKNIVQFYGVVVQDEPLMILLEFATGGSLQSFLRKNAIKIRLVHRARFVVDAAEGMAYLEKQKCIHRDIAARNCLIGAGAEVKISDFGLSMHSTDKLEGGRLPIKWLAPECLTSKLFTHKSDVWAFGVLLWEIFADGADPYPSMTNAMVKEKVVKDRYRMTPPDGTPDKMATLMKNCWNPAPERRPTFKSVKETSNKWAEAFDLSSSGLDI